MARPREFNEDDVLDTMLELFWTRGFDATSIQDLVDATGLGRASLYGAFGDKAQVYQRALKHYLAKGDAHARALESEPSVRVALTKMLEAQLSHACPRSGPKGCFLQLAATASEERDSFARSAYHEVVRRSEKNFEALIRRGQAQGEISPDRDPAATAKLLLVLMQGIASSARAGWSREKLNAVVAEAVTQIAGTASPG